MDYELETDDMVAFNFHFVSEEERDLPVTYTRSSMQGNIPATELSNTERAQKLWDYSRLNRLYCLCKLVAVLKKPKEGTKETAKKTKVDAEMEDLRFKADVAIANVKASINFGAGTASTSSTSLSSSRDGAKSSGSTAKKNVVKKKHDDNVSATAVANVNA